MPYSPSLSFDFIQDHRTTRLSLAVKKETQNESKITLYSLYIVSQFTVNIGIHYVVNSMHHHKGFAQSGKSNGH